MDKQSREKTAFTCRQGLFKFDMMPFGLCNGTSTFQRLMDVVLGKLKWQCALVYVNDINIHSKTFEEHMFDLQQVFDKLRLAKLKLKPSKCVIGMLELTFL